MLSLRPTGAPVSKSRTVRSHEKQSAKLGTIVIGVAGTAILMADQARGPPIAIRNGWKEVWSLL